VTPDRANSADERQGENWLAAVWRSPATRWLLLIACVVCAAGWVWELRPLETVWGNVAEWVGGLATAGGLYFAGRQIRHASQARAEEEAERREAQARAVALSEQWDHDEDAEGFHISCRLVNGGDYPIDAVTINICRLGADPHNLKGEDLVDMWLFGTVLPKQDINKKKLVPYDDCYGEEGSAHVSFLDTWNQEWIRGPRLLARVPPPAILGWGQ
jgi:hypothetical protein